MWSRLLGTREGLTVIVAPLVGVVVYFTLSGLSYLIVYVLGRRRFHPSYVPDRAQNRRAMKVAVLGTSGAITLGLPLQILLGGGHGRIYWAVTEHGIPWLVISFVLYVAFVDTWIYWTHRSLLHSDFLYSRTHRYHHEWRVPNSWVSMAFHPLDSFIFALPVQLFAFVVPLNGYLYVAMQGVMSLWSVASHDRVAVFRFRWFNYVDNHTLHHWFYRWNYGQFFTLWDRMMGTWKNPVEEVGSGRVPKEVLR